MQKIILIFLAFTLASCRISSYPTYYIKVCATSNDDIMLFSKAIEDIAVENNVKIKNNTKPFYENKYRSFPNRFGNDIYILTNSGNELLYFSSIGDEYNILVSVFYKSNNRSNYYYQILSYINEEKLFKHKIYQDSAATDTQCD